MSKKLMFGQKMSRWEYSSRSEGNSFSYGFLYKTNPNNGISRNFSLEMITLGFIYLKRTQRANLDMHGFLMIHSNVLLTHIRFQECIIQVDWAQCIRVQRFFYCRAVLIFDTLNSSLSFIVGLTVNHVPVRKHYLRTREKKNKHSCNK